MLPQPLPALHHPEWAIRPISAAHISLVVSWMAYLDARAEIDQNAVEVQLYKDVTEATESRMMEYRMGFYHELPMFYMAGVPIALSKSFNLLKGTEARQGYEITSLFINPMIDKQLILPVFYPIMEYLFKRRNFLRVIVSVEKDHHLETAALKVLGFRPISFGETNASYQWYGCIQLDFVAL